MRKIPVFFWIFLHLNCVEEKRNSVSETQNTPTLSSWIAQDADSRESLVKMDFATTPLSEKEAEEATTLLIQDHQTALEARYGSQWSARFAENKITFDSESISFKGSYGETLTKAEIKSIELVSELPKITLKTNGFALGTINKGYFKTKNGEVVKLILNSDNKPVILFKKTNGKKIYYSAKDKPNEKVLDEIRKTLTNIV